MRICTRGAALILTAAALILAAVACSAGDDPRRPAAGPARTTAPGPAVPSGLSGSGDAAEPDGSGAGARTPGTMVPVAAPHRARLPWGYFVLADRIAAKLAAGDALNFVMSLTAVGDADHAASLGHGWRGAAAEAAEAHGIGIDAQVIGPHSADAVAQALAITSLVASGDIDCLAVEAANPRLLDRAIGVAVDAGIPVFAVAGDSPGSQRFAFFGIDAYAAGRSTGRLAGEWAAEGGILVRRAAVLTGNARSQRSFDLMRGFVDGLAGIHPGAEFVNGPADVASFGFEPPQVRAATEAWVLDNLDVDMVFHTDGGVEALAQVMAEQSLYGDMYAVGFHMSPPMAGAIRDLLVAISMAERSAEQARRAGAACSEFLLAGVLETGRPAVTPLPVTRDGVDAIDWSLPENR
ncbi:sugar ABC transporter substrate-binding protein [Candidatus Poriferisodalis sp.]|uniref:sugar ABC transporter substrate-binding protein n=1 Tax=Candidatus Poriferisodalis sp. TaxID=3101277 RepID=UPI003B021048